MHGKQCYMFIPSSTVEILNNLWWKSFDPPTHTIYQLLHGSYVLYGKYSTRGVVLKAHTALGFASCCMYDFLGHTSRAVFAIQHYEPCCYNNGNIFYLLFFSNIFPYYSQNYMLAVIIRPGLIIRHVNLCMNLAANCMIVTFLLLTATV